MRRLQLIFVLLLAVPFPGCVLIRHIRKPGGPQIVTANLREATRGDLVNAINSASAKIQTIDATVDIQASVGGQKKGSVTDYTDIKGYLLVREPDMLRMIGLFPVVRNKAFDMVSSGGQFKLSIPTKNKFYIGTDQPGPHSANPLENLRPQVIFSALLLHAIDPRNEEAVLEVGWEEVPQGKNENKVVERPDYELIVIHHGEEGPYLSRKVIFSRTDLQPHRQLIYDRLGNLATDARYDSFQDYNGVQFPSVIEINRPQEEYTITLKMEKLTMNEALRPDQFVLNQPAGAEIIQLDEIRPHSNAASTSTAPAAPPHFE